MRKTVRAHQSVSRRCVSPPVRAAAIVAVACASSGAADPEAAPTGAQVGSWIDSHSSASQSLYLPHAVVSRPPALEPAATIGGAARSVAVDGDAVYVAMGGRVVVFEMTAHSALRQIGATPVLPTDVQSLVVRGGTAYATLGPHGVRILDVSEPTSPEVVGSYTASGLFSDFVLDTGYMYLADQWHGLHILDVTDPADPRVVGTYEQFAHWIAYSRQRVLLASGHGGLTLLDVADPTAPSLIAHREEHEILFGDIAADGRYAYVITTERWTSKCRLEVIDLEGPPLAGSPLAPIRTVDLESGYRIGIHGDRLFVASMQSLAILDISHSGSPAVEHVLPSATGTYDLDITQDHVYLVSAFQRHLTLVDLRVPSSPVVTYPDIRAVHCADIAVTRGWAYTVDRSAGTTGSIRAFHSSALDPVREGRTREGPTVDEHWNLWLSATHDTLFAVRWADFKAFDVSRSPDSKGLWTYPTESRSNPWLGTVTVEEPYAYIGLESGRLEILDITDGAGPRRVSLLTVDPSRDVLGIAARGPYMFVCLSHVLGQDSRGVLAVYELGSETKPRRVGALSFPGDVEDIELFGDLAYVAVGNDLYVVDIADSDKPLIVSDVSLGGPIKDIAIARRTAFAAVHSGTLVAIDITEAERPRLVGTASLPGEPNRLAVDGQDLFVAAMGGGCIVFDMTPWF